MRKITAGKFKTHCLSVIRDIQATGKPVIVTKRGAPMVKIVPVASEENELFGFMAGEFKITGDVEFPVIPTEERGGQY